MTPWSHCSVRMGTVKGTFVTQFVLYKSRIPCNWMFQRGISFEWLDLCKGGGTCRSGRLGHWFNSTLVCECVLE